MKQKIIPVASVLIGLIAFFLTYKYLHDERARLAELQQEIYRGAQKIRVMGAREDIPGGAVLQGRDLGTLEVFKSSVGSHVVMPEHGRMLLGKKTLLPLKGGEPIFWSHVEGGATAALGLASTIKPGMRAVTLAVSGPAAVNGMVQPNDRVDILGTFSFPSKTDPAQMETVTLTILQNVTVLAIGRQLAGEMTDGRGTQTGSSGNVTVEISPREAELLVFAQPVGRLSLALRNPTDVGYLPNLPDVNFQLLQTSLSELNLIRQQQLGGRPLTSGTNTR